MKKITKDQRDFILEKFHKSNYKCWEDPDQWVEEILNECTEEKEPSIKDIIMQMRDGSITFDEMLAKDREDNSKPFTPQHQFEKVIESEFGERIRNDDDFAIRMYAALCNNDWVNIEKEESYGASFRSNGGLIARIRGKGETYLTWYCSNYGKGYADGYVDPEIEEGFAKHGWTYEAM